MENNYVIILDNRGFLTIIKLSEEQKEESYKYEDFEEYLQTIAEEYELDLSNSQWSAVEELKIEKFGFEGKEVHHA